MLQDRFDDYRELCQSFGCRFVEVSNGTISLSSMEKVGYITKLADDFRVVSEVGFKDAERSERLAPNRWIEDIARRHRRRGIAGDPGGTRERSLGDLPSERRAPSSA